MNLAYMCDKGLTRDENEDSILVDEKEKLFIVADGMGGHTKGSVASSVIVDSFRNLPSRVKRNTINHNTIKELLNKELIQHIANITNYLINYTKSQQIHEVIGSTLVGLYKCPLDESWAIFHMGDSRLYHYRDSKLTQLTLDHINKNSNSNIINRAIGNFPMTALDVNYFSPKKGDYFILCSDGVTDYLTNQELLSYLLKYHDSLALLCQYIKELIYKRGAEDNFSFIIFEVGEGTDGKS